jgi:LPS export ABC transporter protein LptC
MNTPEPKTFVTLGLLLFIALTSIYISSEGSADKQKGKRPILSMAYYLRDAELTGTDPEGAELFKIRTQYAAQGNDDSGINLTEVSMVYGPPTALPWDLTANTGYIPEDMSIIELHGDVVAVSVAADKPKTIIRTQHLDINPATRQANTKVRVQLDVDGRIVNATGMEANFETNDLKLLSNVSGKFLP